MKSATVLTRVNCVCVCVWYHDRSDNDMIACRSNVRESSAGTCTHIGGSRRLVGRIRNRRVETGSGR